jgi:hypothetical protein
VQKTTNGSAAGLAGFFMGQKSDETHSDAETQRPVEATLRAAFNTPPKPTT